MGANGSFASGYTDIEDNRNFKTRYSIGDNIKILELKNPKGSLKLPEESHTPNRVYAIFNKDGHSIKALAQYGPDGKKIFEIHTTDHKGLGTHYHTWSNESPSKDGYHLTDDIQKLLNKVLSFN